MLNNYIKTALRNIRGNKFYSIINILGLSIGMACALLLLLYVRDELTYDKYHKNYKNIYRLESVYKFESGTVKMANTAVPLGPVLKDEFTEVKDYVRFLYTDREFFKYEGTEFIENKIYYSDPSVFDVFSHRLIRGSTGALKTPYSMVMTESLAKKYFKDKNPIGKIIVNSKGKSFKITGVMEDVPSNSHLKFDALISMSTRAEIEGRADLESRSPDNLYGGHMNTYVLLNKGASISRVIENSQWFRKKYFFGSGNNLGDVLYLDATPLAETHFTSGIHGDQPNGNIGYVYILAVLAVLLILISSINYLNMATACASKREKEVGLRKVMGAFNSQIIKQFLVESIIFSILAFLISLVLVEILFPLFRQISGKDLSLLSYSNFILIVPAFLLSIAVGLLSGSYPAFFISRYVPSRILGHRPALQKNGLLRNLLVVAQFSISIIVIIATSIVFQQSHFMKSKDLGYIKRDVIVQKVGIRGKSIQTSIEVLKQELKKSPFIIDTAASTGSLDGHVSMVLFHAGSDENKKEIQMCILAADYNYLDLMGIELKDGRKFNREIKSDQKHACIINETAAGLKGWEQHAIGKRIRFDPGQNGQFDDPGDVDAKVIGVVKDFHFQGLQKEILPCVILVLNDGMPADSISIKIQHGKAAEVLKFIDQKARELNRGTVPDYYFLEEKLPEFYRNEERLLKILGTFSIVSILISCMGLLGLSSYMTEQRTKEIGVRKVLGARVSGILFMISREFLFLVLIANIIAWPVSGYIMHRWLENFAYRISPGLSVFLQAAAAGFLIALITVSYQAVKAASKDPIKALRYE